MSKTQRRGVLNCGKGRGGGDGQLSVFPQNSVSREFNIEDDMMLDVQNKIPLLETDKPEH